MWQFGIATTLWGCMSAGVALLLPGRAGPLVLIGAAIPLLLAAAATGRNPWRQLRSSPRLYARLGFLEAANMVLYLSALALGPAPVVIALHLSAPIMLLLLALFAGQRAVSPVAVFELVLVAAAIALISARPGPGSDIRLALLGCGLAVASAAAVTALIIAVSRESGVRDPLSAAGLQLGAAGIISAPLALTIPWNAERAVIELVLGATLLAPGFLLYWVGMRHLSPPTAGIIALNEAVVASILIAAVDRSQISTTALVSGALVAAAVVLAIGQRSPRSPRPIPNRIST